jgi:hypothetical protein
LRERIEQVSPDIYHKFGLRFNPFPAAGSSPEHPKIIRGVRTTQLQRVLDYLVTTYNSATWVGLVITAEYGNGKTYVLKLIRDEVNGTFMEGKPGQKAIAIYLENIGDNLFDLLSRLVDELSPRLVNAAWSYVMDSLDPQEVRKLATDITLNSTQKIAGASAESYLKSLELARYAVQNSFFDKNKLLNRITKILSTVLTVPEFARCVATILVESDERLVSTSWRFVKGNKLYVRDIKNLDITKSRLQAEEIAKSILPGLVHLMRSAGFKIIYLIIDEIEDLIPLTPLKAKRDYLGHIRQAIDQLQQNFTMVLGSTPGGWNDLEFSSPPLAERFGIVIDLAPLSPSETVDLISGYLNTVRIVGAADEIAPFDQESISAIWTHTKGSVRRILDVCNGVLHEAAQDVRQTNIDLRFVQTFLKKLQ